MRRHLLELSVKQLPGVGCKLEPRLVDLGIKSVRDLRAAGRALLQRELGDKSGDALWRSAHGRDDRVVKTIKARKCAARPLRQAHLAAHNISKYSARAGSCDAPCLDSTEARTVHAAACLPYFEFQA